MVSDFDNKLGKPSHVGLFFLAFLLQFGFPTLNYDLATFSDGCRQERKLVFSLKSSEMLLKTKKYAKKKKQHISHIFSYYTSCKWQVLKGPGLIFLVICLSS